MERESFTTLYAKNKDLWDAMTKRACSYAGNMLPEGEIIRPDDITEVLVPFVKLENLFIEHWQKRSIMPKYLSVWFSEYLIDVFLKEHKPRPRRRRKK